MKILNSIFFLSLLILIGCSKTAVNPGQADAFIKFFGNSWTDEGNDVVQLADGGYIMIGTTTSMEGDEDIALVRTDQYGNEQWAKFFGGPGDDEGNSVRATIDGGFILLGSYHDTLAQEHNIFLIKTDVSGIATWTSDTIGRGRGDQTGNCIQELSDGYIITGTSFVNDTNKILLVRTDQNGSYLEDGHTWYKAKGYGTDNHGNYVVKHPEQDRFVILGTTSLEKNGLLNSNLIVISAPSNGFGANDIFGGAGSDRGGSIQHVQGNEFIFTGTLDEGPDSRMYIEKLIIDEETINSVWNHLLGTTGRTTGNSVQCTLDGGFAVLGSVQSSPGNSDFYLVITDGVGTPLAGQSMNYGGSGNEFGASLERTSDGGYVMIGSTGIPEDDNRMFALIKVKSTGSFQ